MMSTTALVHAGATGISPIVPTHWELTVRLVTGALIALFVVAVIPLIPRSAQHTCPAVAVAAVAAGDPGGPGGRADPMAGRGPYPCARPTGALMP